MAGKTELVSEDRKMKQQKKEYKNGRKAQFLIGAASVSAGAALILYLTNGTNKLCPELSILCIIALALSLAIGIFLLAFHAVKGSAPALLCYVQYFFALLGFGEYIVSQLNYIANVFYGVDGNTFSNIMILTALTSLLNWVFALSAANTLRKTAYKRDLTASARSIVQEGR